MLGTNGIESNLKQLKQLFLRFYQQRIPWKNLAIFCSQLNSLTTQESLLIIVIVIFVVVTVAGFISIINIFDCKFI